MKLFTLTIALAALSAMLSGCSFAITPLLFLDNRNEAVMDDSAPRYCGDDVNAVYFSDDFRG